MAQPGKGGRLVLQRLAKRYQGMVAVDGIDLDVAGGEFVTLLGPSGSGKTTTLMMVAGFTPPTGGDVALDGRSLTALPPERRGIGVVFQNYALFPHMSVAQNVGFPLRMRGVARAEIAARVRRALAMVQLGGLDERLPGQLSGGQQQRVALARAVVFDPGLLLMDEPLGALDKNLREDMQSEIRRIHRELGVTVIYVTHDQGEALTMSDRVALMNRGRIEQVGTAEDLYERPANRFVATFIGESNLVDGTLERDGGGWAVRAGGMALPAGGPGPLAAGVPCALVLRPEKIALQPSGGGLGAQVRDLTYVGDFSRYRLDLGGGVALTAKVANRSGAYRPAVGESVRASWAAADAAVVPAETR
ncbi:MAG: ABC transporter ATP-binding protein [Alphaproteobacteria bacterium]|nr:ABC transporter ATP-binding protein [Alphaproteobacteria bacterium]